LNELIGFNPNGNFDRVSALIMIMILKEDMFQYTEKKQIDKVKTLAEDAFFNRNFDVRRTKLAISASGIATNRSKDREPGMQYETLLKKDIKNS
jgi:hypothetical protein